MALKQNSKYLQDFLELHPQVLPSPTEKMHFQGGLESLSADVQQDQSIILESDNNSCEAGVSLSETAGLHPKILYHRVCKDAEGTIVENIESPEPIPAGDTGASKTLTDRTVLEVLTTKEIGTKTYMGSKNITTKIKVYSLYVINVLRDIVLYWPGLNLLDHPVVIEAPYKVLIHHLDDLEAYKSNHPICHSREYVELCNDHIDTLLGFLDKSSGYELRLERQRHQKSPPMATFANLWMLFKPGQDVYIKERETKAAIPMRVGVTYESFLLPGDYRPGKGDSLKNYGSVGDCDRVLRVQGWGVSCNGTQMSTQVRQIDIEHFEGEKEILSLNAYPKEFHGNPNYEQELQRRGKRYWELCEPAYRHYDGATVADRDQPQVQLNGRIVVDFKSYVKYKYKKERQNTYMMDSKISDIHSSWKEIPSSKGCKCEHCIESIYRKTRPPPVFDFINVNDAKTQGDPQMYFLTDYILRGYALKEQKFLSFHIDQVHDLRVEEAPFDNLILPEDIKQTIQSIAWSYKQPWAEVKAWSADFIKEKGEGQIFLLHGTPGVGKTCTAEIVADYIKRPLLPLTCGDMGITASDVQENINKYFELGELWGAVILMDEADIYLEQRAPDQLERNSLVSVFLRSLEYFKGILFITTNRVGTFDDAFISRIHVSLYYPPLVDRDRVLIWESNFRRLEKDTAIKIPEATRIFTRYDEGLKLIKWNGREIRNAFQTAIALAKKEASDKKMTNVALEAKHIEAVVKMSRLFKAYITEVNDNLDESGRARRNQARADSFTLEN